jgi:hypothetical protein
MVDGVIPTAIMAGITHHSILAWEAIGVMVIGVVTEDITMTTMVDIMVGIMAAEAAITATIVK